MNKFINFEQDISELSYPTFVPSINFQNENNSTSSFPMHERQHIDCK